MCIRDSNWLEDMAFEAQIGDHHLIMDAAPEVGGQNTGPRPKPLLLAALAGCSGMDVVSILKKMHVEVTEFRMVVEGDLTEEHPKYFKEIVVNYFFKGINLDPEKLKKAVDLSQDKYCGVSAQLKFGATVRYEIVIE
jgi:putative redox protein